MPPPASPPAIPPPYGCGNWAAAGERLEVDLKTSTNPAFRMEWQDATGATFNGIDDAALIVSPRFPDGVEIVNMVQTGTTDTSGGPFPGGALRLRSAGVYRGEAFDLLITVPSGVEETYASDFMPLEYKSPMSSFVSQVTVTAGGAVCLGVGIPPSTCEVDGSPEAYSASCPNVVGPEGEQLPQGTIFAGTEFEVQFVKTGTSTPIDPVDMVMLTFYDVDGDDGGDGGKLYELSGAVGAVQVLTEPDTSL